LTSLATM
jgi:tetratricopeptide (TPR) repeat protein